MIASFFKPGVEFVSKAVLLLAALKSVKTRPSWLFIACGAPQGQYFLYSCQGYWAADFGAGFARSKSLASIKWMISSSTTNAKQIGWVMKALREDTAVKAL